MTRWISLPLGSRPWRTVLTDFLQQRHVGAQIQHRIGISTIAVVPPQKIWHDKDVVLLPIEALAANLYAARAFEHDVHRLAQRLVGSVIDSAGQNHPQHFSR